MTDLGAVGDQEVVSGVRGALVLAVLVVLGLVVISLLAGQ